jgi:hypothetical protein
LKSGPECMKLADYSEGTLLLATDQTDDKDQVIIPIRPKTRLPENHFLHQMKKALPAELWLHIASYLVIDDQALEFIVSIIELSQAQALMLAKQYILCSSKNPTSAK